MIAPIDLAPFMHHGGALDVATAVFPAAPKPWIDLSTGINPVAYPLGTIPFRAWTTLPDDSALDALERAAAQRYRAPPGIAVVAGPGTQAVIQRLPSLYPGEDVRILGRTYGEFERVFATARVRIVPTPQRLAGADTAIVVNPNNPDGRLVTPDDLTSLAKRVGTLIVDEAFMDGLAPACSVVPRLAGGRMIVLRSFGKIYGLPGVRLGFALLPVSDGDRLRGMLGPWPVAGPTIYVATQALLDEEWLDMTTMRLRIDGARLDYLLGHVGGRSIGATPLFHLYEHPAAPALFIALARHGILARPFHGEPTWVRFGIPAMEADWERLEMALSAFRA